MPQLMRGDGVTKGEARSAVGDRSVYLQRSCRELLVGDEFIAIRRYEKASV